MTSERVLIHHRRGRFTVLDHPAVREVLPNFLGGFEAATLDVFDAVLPTGDAVIDIGAHVGLMTLYAACQGVPVTAFEPNPDTLALLRANLAANPALAARVAVVPAALSDRDGRATLFAKAAADSGSSLSRTVERGRLVDGRPVGAVTVRDAAVALEALSLTNRTLVKLDAEGAEYAILPHIAQLLAARLPVLHVSFHPFNIVSATAESGRDAYATDLRRLRAGLAVAEALSCYDFMYACAGGRWTRFGPSDRMDLLRGYLLALKPVPGIASPQFGFTDAWAFAAEPIPALDAPARQAALVPSLN